MYGDKRGFRGFCSRLTVQVKLGCAKAENCGGFFRDSKYSTCYVKMFRKRDLVEPAEAGQRLQRAHKGDREHLRQVCSFVDLTRFRIVFIQIDELCYDIVLRVEDMLLLKRREER